MKAVVVACETVRKELEQALKNTGRDYPVLWLESGLHSVPANLHKRLVEALTRAKDIGDLVLLAMGFCGNSVAGLTANGFQLIVPKVDDCITLLLGSSEKRQKISREYAAYFLTQGWLQGERNIIRELQYMKEKFGEKQAREIGKMMYHHYRTLVLLDTGVDSMEELRTNTAGISSEFGWKQETVQATLGYLEKLLTGPWDQDLFIVKNPGEKIELKDLYEIH